MDGSEKIPISLPFSKLVLDDVKVELLLISWHFLVVFWLHPPPIRSLTPSFFGILKVHNGTYLGQVSLLFDYL